MAFTLKQEFWIRLIILIVVVILCLAIYINGKNLSCDKCSMHFSAFKKKFGESSNERIQDYTIKMMDFYRSLKEDRCILIWEKGRGYIYLEELRWKQ